MPDDDDWSLEDDLKSTIEDALSDSPPEYARPAARKEAGRQEPGVKQTGPAQQFVIGAPNSARYRVAWKVALVFEEDEHKPTYHGRTHDLSLSGTGMLTSVNLYTDAPVIMLIAPPPLHQSVRQKIIEVKARQQYVLYSGEAGAFRLGFAFLEFKKDGFEVLKERLKHHQPIARDPQTRQISIGSFR